MRCIASKEEVGETHTWVYIAVVALRIFLIRHFLIPEYVLGLRSDFRVSMFYPPPFIAVLNPSPG